ncbi:MAG: DEAD/DEAH box helicase [Pseudomonadota bacterium]
MYELREYQQKSVDLALQRVSEGQRPIICAPTGSGKSIIAAEIARRSLAQGKRSLIASGRREIIEQMTETVSKHCGVANVSLLMAGERYRHGAPITVASWDTLKARWDKSHAWRVSADTVLWDECHLSLSKKMSEKVLPFYENSDVIGLTATPAKKSGRGLGSYYTRIIRVRTVRELQDDGYLARTEYWAGSHIDTSKLRTKQGDFDGKQLASASNDAKLVGDVVDNWLRLASDRHTIVFAVDIAHAEALASGFQSAGIEAEVLHSQIDLNTRKLLTQQFKRKKFQVLVNVNVATYGYDVPSVNCVVLARATKSIVMHHQAIGRGLRPKSDNDYLVVLDHGDNVRRLGFIEDEIRWRLDETRSAATNYKRQKDDEAGRERDLTKCKQCSHLFTASRTCPKCGWEKPRQQRHVETVDANLVKIARDQGTSSGDEFPEPKMFYRMLRGYAASQGYSDGWAAHRWKEKHSKFPPKEWKHLTPLVPHARVKSWVRSRQIAWAKRPYAHANG